MRSLRAEFGATFAVGGLGSSSSNVMLASLCHRPRDGLDIDQKRLVFRRLDIGVADVGRQRIRAEALLARAPVKPQCSGMPTMCTVLPSQMSGRMRLVTTAFAFTEPRFDHTLTQPPEVMPFSFASSSEISTKNSGCSDGVGLDVLGPEVEVLGQPVGRCRVGEVVGVAELLHIVLEHPRGRIAA